MALVTKMLRRTKEYIVDYGWIRGTFGDMQRGFCLDGALIRASSEAYDGAYDVGADGYKEARRLLQEEINLLVNMRRGDPAPVALTVWNDVYGSKEAVLEIIDAAIVTSEAQ